MWSEVVALFSGYGVIPMIFILAGIVLCIVEVFMPGFGVFGILGGICTIGGIVARMIMGATVTQFLFMVLGSVSLVVLFIIIMLISAKFGMIRHSALVETKTSISANYVKDNKELLKMLGKTTFASTDFRPSGKFEYNGETFQALTYGEYITKGTKIQIVEVKADTIYVKASEKINMKNK